MSGATEARARTVTADLVRYATRTKLTDLPSSTIANAKLAILDTMACTLAASRFPVGAIVIAQAADDCERGASTIWPTGTRVSAPVAAYVNGHLANALDYDNSLHLDTHVLPAAVAVAESVGASGAEFLEAYLIAREVGARLMRALDGRRDEGLGVSHRGWWHVGLVAPLDSALVAARLLRLDERATASALGIASCSVGGFRRSLGTMAKSLHSGKAARDGIQAAMLAQSGFTGDPEILEAPMGYIAALCPSGEFDYDALYDGLGSRYTLSSPPKMKPYPACGPAITQIDTLRELRTAHWFDVDDIERIEVNFHRNSLFRSEARDSIEAGFSTPYLVAVTVMDGRFGLAQLEEGRVHDRQVRALMGRVVHVPGMARGEVTIELKDGRRLNAGTDERRWLSNWDEVAAKFLDAAETRLPAVSAVEFMEALKRIESLTDINQLLSILRSGTERQGPDDGAPVRGK